MKSFLLKKYINLTLRIPAARKLYPLFSPIWNGFNATPNYFDACDILENFHPDQGEGSLCDTKPLPPAEYDLLVVVATYNVGPYIAECIDSIISQKTSYRILLRIVNDASTDATSEIIARYASNPMVQIITHSKNRGPAAARNSALANLNATYICNVDGDDMLAPDTLETWLNKAFSNDADIVATGFSRFDCISGKSVYNIVPKESDDVDIIDVYGLPTIFLY